MEKIDSHSQWPSILTCLPHLGQMERGIGDSVANIADMHHIGRSY